MATDDEFELLNRLVEAKDRELESVFDLVADGIGKFACNDEFSILYYNWGLADLVGADRGLVESQGFDSSLYIYEEDYPKLQAAIAQAIERDEPFSVTYRLKHTDGRLIWVKTNGLLIDELYQDTYPIMYLFYTDITDIVETSERLSIELKRHEALMALTGEMFVEYDYIDDELLLLGGFPSYYDGDPRIEHYSVFLSDSADDADSAVFRELYRLFREGGDDFFVERRLPRKDGSIAWFSIDGKRILSGDGLPRKVLCRITDIDERKKREEALEKSAKTDDLTGVYNQGAAYALIADRQKSIQKDEISVFMMLDFDHFKEINDTFGHPLGDRVLSEGMAVVRSVLRDDDLVGRLGGDEFCLYMRNLSSTEEAEAIASRICRAVTAMDGMAEIGVTCSIGMSSSVGGDKTYDELYAEADRALYSVKEAGRNGFGFGASEG